MNHGSETIPVLDNFVAQLESLTIIAHGHNKFGIFVGQSEHLPGPACHGNIDDSIQSLIIVEKQNILPARHLDSSLRNHGAVSPCSDDVKAAHFILPRNFSIVA